METIGIDHVTMELCSALYDYVHTKFYLIQFWVFKFKNTFEILARGSVTTGISQTRMKIPANILDSFF